MYVAIGGVLDSGVPFKRGSTVKLMCISSYPEVTNVYEYFHSGYLREWALEECLEHIRADDRFTHGISIGPVGAQLFILFATSAFPVIISTVDEIGVHACLTDESS